MKEKGFKEQKEWIIPCNKNYYNLDEALKELKIIDWRQPRQLKNAQVGDLVYIYLKPVKGVGSIRYKGAILETNKMELIIDDSKFAAGGNLTKGPCITVAMFREYSLGDELSYSKLKEAGLKSTMQGPIMVKGNVGEYLHKCDREQRQIERLKGVIPATCLADFPIEVQEFISE